MFFSKGTSFKTAEGWSGSYITINKITTDKQPAPPENGHVIGVTYNLGPEGASFSPEITLTLLYDEANIPNGLKETELFIGWWDNKTQEWVPLDSTVDTLKHLITAKLSHFTPYAVLARSAANIEPTPTPARGPTVTPAISPSPIMTIEPTPSHSIPPDATPSPGDTTVTPQELPEQAAVLEPTPEPTSALLPTSALPKEQTNWYLIIGSIFGIIIAGLVIRRMLVIAKEPERIE